MADTEVLQFLSAGPESWKAYIATRMQRGAFDTIDISDADLRGVDLQNLHFPARTLFYRSKFGSLCLRRTTFDGVVSFDDALIEGETIIDLQEGNPGTLDFNNARFNGPVTILDLTGINRLIFDNCHFAKGVSAKYADPDDVVQFPYRTLKLAMNEQHALSEEAGFFLLEMRSRARTENWSRRAMFIVYDALSAYGQSVKRPFLWLCGVTAFFGLLYSWLSGQRWETFDPQLFALTIFGAVPFVGTLHWSEITPAGETPLFPPAVVGYVQIALVVQAIISAILLFLIGLGLRNLFKIR